MKKILTLNFLMIYILGNTQNLIKNSGFEDLTNPVYSYTQISQPFYWNKVKEWRSFQNSAEIYDASRNSIFEGNVSVFFWSTQTDGIPNYNEGIYQNEINFKKGKIYQVSVHYWIKPNYSDNVSLKIIAANNLHESTENLNFNQNVTTIETIGASTDNNRGQWIEFKTIYIPTTDYSQIALFSTLHHNQSGSTDSRLIIDKVIVTESCCASKVDYSNTTNPPSINVQDYVRCNSNVSFNNNSVTDLRAKNEVLLANNTSISGVSSFTASSEDCLAKTVEFYATIEQAKCNYRVNLSACYGSGQYEFYFGEELSTSKYKDYPIANAGNNITVKVKDLVTGLFTIKIIQLPTNPKYSGAFTINIPNVFTPNGDGYNDEFRVIDAGKTRFAYNATKYRLQIWNRWGNNVLDKENEINEDDINGFNDQEIFWNGRVYNDPSNSFVTSGTYYYSLYIANCNNSQNIANGSITVIGSLSKTNIIETTIKEIDYNRKTEISPNPTNNNLNIKLFTTNIKTNILITDILGKQLIITSALTADKDGLKEYNIDCSELSNGIYFLTVLKGNSIETLKFSVMK